MVRKMAAWVLICVMLFAFAGCGKEKDGSEVQNTKSAVDQANNAKAEDINGEITVWIWEDGKMAFDALENDFKKAYPNITVKYEIIPNEDLYKKYMLVAQTGEGGPDVFAVESSEMPRMIQTKTLMDVKELLGSDVQKINKHKIEMATGEDGGIYAVPWDSAPVGVFYNKKLFKKAGLPGEPAEVEKALSTWDKYYETMKQIKEKTGVYATFSPKTKVNPSLFESMLAQKSRSENIWYFDKDGNVKIDSPQSVRIAQYLTKMFEEDLIYDAQAFTQQSSDAIKNEKVATIVNAAWFAPLIKDAYGKDKEGEWGVVPMPVWGEGDSRTSENGGSNLVITKQTKNLNAAWAYTKFYLLSDSSQLMQYKYGFFPSWEPVYGNAEVCKPDPFFGGQNVSALFEELAKEIPPMHFTVDYARAREAVSTALELCYNDKDKTVDQHLKQAADEVRKKTGRK